MNDNVWKHRRVFITGCTGLLGSWLTQELVMRGADVVGLIRDNVAQSNFYRLSLHNKIKFVQGGFEDYLLLERVLNEYEIEVIYHTGAQTIIKIANDNPLSTFESNIKGTWNILESARRHHLVKAVIIASSDKAYGGHKNLPYTEDLPLQGSYPYDVSKSCSDLLAQAYFRTYNLPVCITRCGNLFGGGDLNFNRIVPGTILSLLHNQSPVIRSDGTLTRDYIYVPDVVHAYLLLGEKILEGTMAGEAFNFSYEHKISVKELVDLMIKIIGSDLSPVIKNEAWGEIKDQYLSSEKARRLLSWKPLFSLEEGLKETINWYKDYFKTI